MEPVGLKLVVGGLWGSPACDGDEMPPWLNFRPMRTDDLSEETADTVALDSSADFTSSHESESELGYLGHRQYAQDEVTAWFTGAFFLHEGELAGLFQPQMGWQAHGGE